MLSTHHMYPFLEWSLVKVIYFFEYMATSGKYIIIKYFHNMPSRKKTHTILAFSKILNLQRYINCNVLRPQPY